jgi:ferredoxin
MSAPRPKFRENVPGKYSINEHCIGCSLCRETAPENFCINYEEGYDYVCKQPATPEEEKRCLKAMQSCPADAIVNDSSEEQLS